NLPTKASKMAQMAAQVITRGSKFLVSTTAPVTSEQVALGGPPTMAAAEVARPSLSRVRCSPGLWTKFLPVTELITTTSPICSTTGARATGIINKMAAHSKVGVTKLGRASQGAAAIAEVSTMPKAKDKL